MQTPQFCYHVPETILCQTPLAAAGPGSRPQAVGVGVPKGALGVGAFVGRYRHVAGGTASRRAQHQAPQEAWGGGSPENLFLFSFNVPVLSSPKRNI